MHRIDITRSLLEATIDKALRDLQTDPERSVRNLVDLAQSFSNGRFQKNFFSIIQSLLEDQDSAYYTLVRSVVSRVDHQTLKTFGINLGYNGCTVGAERIRRNEQELHFNIPWSVAFMLDRAAGSVSSGEIAETIRQGKALGVYTYLLFCNGDTVRDAVALARMFDDCAFLVFFSPECLDAQLADELRSCHNCLLSLDADKEDCARAAALLWERQCLYALHTFYTQDRLEEIRSDAWLRRCVSCNGVFAFLISRGDYDGPVQRQIRAYTLQVRNRQQYPIFLIDLSSDLLSIDEIVSDEACSMGFDAQGRAWTRTAASSDADCNLRNSTLTEILRRVTPKSASC